MKHRTRIVAEEVHRVLARFDEGDLLFELAAKQRDRDVGAPEMLLRAVRDRPLRDPDQRVLRKYVVKDGASFLVIHRRLVPRHEVLMRRLDAVRRGVDLVADVVGVRVIHRHPDLKLAARGADLAGLGVERKDHR